MCHLATIELPYDSISLSLNGRTSYGFCVLTTGPILYPLLMCVASLQSPAETSLIRKESDEPLNSWALCSREASQQVKVGYQVTGIISKKIKMKAL